MNKGSLLIEALIALFILIGVIDCICMLIIVASH